MSILIVSVLEEFLGNSKKHTEDKCQIAFDCPACAADKGMYHGDGKGNLEINYEKGVFKCWACAEINNMQGPVSKLINRFGTKKQLKHYLVLKPEVNYNTENKIIKEVDLKLPEGFKLLSECDGKEFKYNIVIKYLHNRGITDDIIKEFDIGYTIKGPYHSRIIIPSYDANGILNYFIARSFDYKVKPKYRNPDSDEVPKSEIVFNEVKINWDATIYLVEGPTDHIVVPNSIPILGKYISNKLKYLIHEKARGLVVVLLDDDAYKDAVVLCRELNFGDLYGRVRICVPPAGYDPSKINETLGKKGIVKLLRNTRKLNKEELF